MSRTAHRLPPEMSIADLVSIGDRVVSAVYLGGVEVYTRGSTKPVGLEKLGSSIKRFQTMTAAQFSDLKVKSSTTLYAIID